MFPRLKTCYAPLVALRLARPALELNVSDTATGHYRIQSARSGLTSPFVSWFQSGFLLYPITSYPGDAVRASTVTIPRTGAEPNPRTFRRGDQTENHGRLIPNRASAGH